MVRADENDHPDSATAARSPIPVIRKPVLQFFRLIVRRYLRRHFRAVRLAADSLPREISGPLVLYGNHSSWWDPMVLVLLAEQLWPARRHYAPMDEAALARYGILQRIGIFPLAPDSARGAAQFLRTAQAILASGGVLWITPQGRFVDARVRPLDFRPGLAALAARTRPITLIPLAIEYTFWDERLPELLIRLGEPIVLNEQRSSFRRHSSQSEESPHFAPAKPQETTEALNERLEAALAATMDDLRAAAIARSPASFRTLLTGTRGTGGIYSILQRVKAGLTGKPYQPDHTVARSGERE